MSFCSRSMLDTGVSGGGGGGGGVAKYTGTITCSYDATGFPADLSFYGFDTGVAFSTFGNRSPTTVSGHTFATLMDFYASTSFSSSILAITGFGSDPLTGFITSVTANGVTLAPDGYSYSTGTATWTFSGGPFGFPTFGTVSCTMIGS